MQISDTGCIISRDRRPCLSLGNGERSFGDEHGTGNAHRRIFTTGSFPNFQHGTIDIGNNGMDLRNIVVHPCDVVIHPCNVVIHPGNDGMSIQCKLGLGVNG
jgi:hypothetical protein